MQAPGPSGKGRGRGRGRNGANQDRGLSRLQANRLQQAQVRAPQQPLHQAQVRAPQQPLHQAQVRAPQQPLHQAQVRAPQQPLHQAQVRAPQQPLHQAQDRPPQQPLHQAQPQPSLAVHTPPPSPPDPVQESSKDRAAGGTAVTTAFDEKCLDRGDSTSAATGALESSGLHLERRARDAKFPRRPGEGKVGIPMVVVANHFEARLPTGKMYHYDVEIGSIRKQEARLPTGKMSHNDVEIGSIRKQEDVKPVTSKDCKRRVFWQLVKQHSQSLNGNLPVFDGQKNMYTRYALGFEKHSFRVSLEEQGREPDEFQVVVQFAAELDLSLMEQLYSRQVTNPEVPRAVVQALEIVLRYCPSAELAVVGRSLFKRPRGDVSLGGGLQLWHGFQTSLRPGQWKPFVNVNTKATAFFEPGPLMGLMSKILADRRGNILDFTKVSSLDKSQIVRLNKKLKKLKVHVTNLRYLRKVTIEKVTLASARELKFGMPPISVAQYFATTYKPLRYPNLPCIEVGTKRNHIPVEVCEVIAGQHCRRKLDENQTTAVIKKAAVPAAKRFENIVADVKQCVNSNQQYLKHFGIRISDRPIELSARVLPAPQVVYQNGEACPKDGAWGLVNKKFYAAASLECWTIVNTCNPRFCDESAIKSFVAMLIELGSQLGMTVVKPKRITNCRPTDDPKTVLTEQRRELGLQMVFVVLAGSGKSSPFYSPLKSSAETDLGILTQCVTDQSITKRCNAATVTNILQKVNAKLGGTNNTIPPNVKGIIFQKPVMVMGADVTHPAPTEMNKPSIAAVVASVDKNAFRYIAAFRIQKQDAAAKARVEIIKDMTAIAKELLLGFFRVNNQVKPEKIIFYRDGVSEGQFSQVQQFELAALRAACRELESGYEPGITFLTVQKRHQTRFMPKNVRDRCGRAGNVHPGTVVDTTVTHPVDFDFFLCSHFGIQGTSRPAHYYVLWDDNDFTADTLQRLTYGLCHTYARCSRSVSVPTPVYYAHLATKRAKCYVDACTDSLDSGSSSTNSMLPTHILDDAVKVAEVMEGKMFFI